MSSVYSWTFWEEQTFLFVCYLSLTRCPKDGMWDHEHHNVRLQTDHSVLSPSFQSGFSSSTFWVENALTFISCVVLHECVECKCTVLSSTSSGESECWDVSSWENQDKLGCWVSSSMGIEGRKNYLRRRALVRDGHSWSSFWVGGCGKAGRKTPQTGT